MKISSGKADAFINSPPEDLRVALIYGPDEGLVRERASMLGAAFVPDLSDPFLVCDLSASDIVGDPALLADEVAAIALTGGRRLVRVRAASDSLVTSVRSLLDGTPGDAMTVLLAGPLGPRSTLRKLAEQSGNAAAIPCYLDDANSLERVIRETLSGLDVRITSEAVGWLVGRLGADRAISRSEMEKLSLFVGPGGEVDLEMARASVGDSAANSIDELVYAAGDGDSNVADYYLTHSFQAGGNPIGILRALTNHLIRLETAGTRIKCGEPTATVLKSLRPPVFYKLERRFQDQLRIWRSEALARGLQLTMDAELQCKMTGLPEQAICGRALFQIASLARQYRRIQGQH
ncbi:MAG: DNA polymerase III subunit delta [Pseudomonadota bacterium]|nr:DNA polymerase III subunit delta [Pseudomonadota bacterium]